MRYRGISRALLLSLALGGTAVAAAAQQRPDVPAREEARGWLGFTFVTEPAGRADRMHVIVRSVVAGSPAERAGLRVGDRILAFDGRPVDDRVLAELSRMTAGRALRARVQRGNARRELNMVSAPRNAAVVLRALDGRAFHVQVDSVVRAVAVLLDSARHVARVHVHTSEAAGDSSTGFFYYLDEEGEVQGSGRLERVQDELRLRTSELRELRALQRAETERLLQALRWQGNGPDELRTELERVRGELRALEASPVRVRTPEGATVRARASGDAPFEVRDPAEAAGWQAAAAPAAVARLPGASMLAYGERAAAGAVFAEMNPGLGEYFGVDRGLLVITVSAGAPAYRAGLREGDVVTTAAGSRVTSIAELRRMLAAAGDDGLPIEVVRKGKRHALRLAR